MFFCIYTFKKSEWKSHALAILRRGWPLSCTNKNHTKNPTIGHKVRAQIQGLCALGNLIASTVV